MACAKAGADIIIEKALGNTYAECLQMMEAAEKYGIKIGLCCIHSATMLYMKQLFSSYKSMTLGLYYRLMTISTLHYFWDGRSPWQLSNEQIGGAALP
ncbi:MAG: hypothetical protein ACOX25_01375 [Caldicoprobacterales bacterium]